MEPKYIFTDLETTGLDPTSDLILEIGMVAVDSDLNVLTTFSRVINWPSIEYDQVTGEYTPPFGVHKTVADMHTKNKLWKESYRSNITLTDALDSAEDWLMQNNMLVPKLNLAGNTIRFDIEFLNYANRAFVPMFHHRSIDVSSIRILYEDWMDTGTDYSAMPTGNDLHRSVPDCYDSIEKLKFFKETLFTWD